MTLFGPHTLLRYIRNGVFDSLSLLTLDVFDRATLARGPLKDLA